MIGDKEFSAAELGDADRAEAVAKELWLALAAVPVFEIQMAAMVGFVAEALDQMNVHPMLFLSRVYAWLEDKQMRAAARAATAATATATPSEGD